jgi:hypothetical protein
VSYDLLSIRVLVGVAVLVGCGRTELDSLVRSAGGTDGATASVGDAAAAPSGPCGEATCLTSLFRSCIPEGSCTLSGAGGPHTTVSYLCYANGVKVTRMSGWNGTNVYRDLTVRRDDALCYNVTASESPSGGGTTYVITGPGGQLVATGTTEPATGAITVTCTDGAPVAISGVCLQPVDESGSACDPNTPC